MGGEGDNGWVTDIADEGAREQGRRERGLGSKEEGTLRGDKERGAGTLRGKETVMQKPSWRLLIAEDDDAEYQRLQAAWGLPAR